MYKNKIKDNPTITVFTPAYNRAYTIHKCYESLKKQTYKNFEWLIYDDGSSDNTKEISIQLSPSDAPFWWKSVASWKEYLSFS